MPCIFYMHVSYISYLSWEKEVDIIQKKRSQRFYQVFSVFRHTCGELILDRVRIGPLTSCLQKVPILSKFQYTPHPSQMTPCQSLRKKSCEPNLKKFPVVGQGYLPTMPLYMLTQVLSNSLIQLSGILLHISSYCEGVDMRHYKEKIVFSRTLYFWKLRKSDISYLS